jgi:hypothetical protein
VGHEQLTLLVPGDSPQLLEEPVQTEAPMHPQVTLPPHEVGTVTQWFEGPSRST